MGFRVAINNASTLLTEPYTAGSGTLVGTPADGPGFVSGTRGAPSSSNPIQVTVCKAANVDDDTRANRVRFLCTSLNSTSCTFTGLTLIEGTDQPFSVGDVVSINVDSQCLEELQSAVGTLQTSLVSDEAAIAALQASREQTANKGQPNGYASLDGSGKVPAAQLPGSGSPVLSVAGRTGDVVLAESDIANLTTDLAAKEAIANKGAANGYASLDGTGKVPSGQLPPAPVTSVAGKTGAVTLAEGDIANLTTDLAATEKTANKGQANGYASLDGGGKVPTSQLPASVVGALEYQGTWNANTNSPALASGVGTKGFYYKVSVAGTTSIDGNASWHVGDWIVFNGTAWDKIDNFEAVTSVAGRVGDITLGENDIANLVSDLAATEKTANKGANSGYPSLDSGGHIPVAQIPLSVVQCLAYQGTWNAATNTPALASGVGTKGQFYLVSTFGTTSIDGTALWNVGDWIAFNGSVWMKVDNGTRIAVGKTWISLDYIGVQGGANLVVGTTNFGAGDESAIIQPYLNAGNVGVRVDKAFCAGTLTLNDNTELVATHKGNGCVYVSNGNSTQFKNATATFGSGAPVTHLTGAPATPGGYGNKDISITGGTWIGNSTNQSNPGHDYPGANPVTTPLNFIRMAGIQRLRVKNANILGYAGFGIWLMNWEEPEFEGLRISYSGSGATLGSDNLHMNSPGRGGFARACHLTSGDNTIAINADDGNGNGGGLNAGGYPISAPGSITDFTMDNIFIDGGGLDCLNFISTAGLIDRIVAKNFHGTTVGGLMEARLFAGCWLNGSGNYGSIILEDWDVQLTGTPFQPGGMYLGVSTGQWTFRKIRRNNWGAVNIPTVYVDWSGGNVDSIELDGLKVQDTSNSYHGLQLYGYADRVIVRNCQVKSASQAATLVNVPYNASNNGTVKTGFGQLILADNQLSNVDYALDVQTQQLQGPITVDGLTHTGSSKTGSINIDGNVGAVVAVGINGPGTASGNHFTGTQNPTLISDGGNVAGTVPAINDFLNLSADANTYSDTTFATPQSTNGGAVKGLKDLIGTSPGIYNATAASNNPTLVTASLNGLNGLTFNGTSMRMALARTLSWPTFTLLCVFKPNTVAAGFLAVVNNWMGDSGGKQWGWVLGINNTGGKACFYANNGQSGVGTSLDFGTLAAGTATLVAITYDGGTAIAGYQWSAGAFGAATSGSKAISYGSVPACVPLLGADENGVGTFSGFFNGVFYQARAFPGTDATKRNTLGSAMATKWGL